MMIVGLTGTIGSGKTTFADFLARQFSHADHRESWQLIAEVAEALRAQGVHPNPSDIAAVNRWLEPLPAIIEASCHKQVAFDALKLSVGLNHDAPEYHKLFQYLDLIRQQPELSTGPINEARKEDLRAILQWLGGYLAAKCGGDIWYAELIRRIRAESGLELATIGGVRFPADAECIKRAGGLIMAIDRSGWSSRDDTDPTERERSQVKVDTIIYNDGTLAQLQSCAQKVATDLMKHINLSEYRASE